MMKRKECIEYEQKSRMIIAKIVMLNDTLCLELNCGTILSLSKESINNLSLFKVGDWIQVDVLESADRIILKVLNIIPRPDYHEASDREIEDFFAICNKNTIKLER